MLVINKSVGLQLRGRPMLLITRMISDRIILHSVPLLLYILRAVPLFQLSPSHDRQNIGEKNKSAPREHWGGPESRGKSLHKGSFVGLPLLITFFRSFARGTDHSRSISSTLVAEVFLDFSPHDRAVRELRGGEHESRSGEKSRKTSGTRIHFRVRN